MKQMAVLALTFCVSLGFAQDHVVPGHYTKSGRWVPPHLAKDGKIGKHRVHRFYPEH